MPQEAPVRATGGSSWAMPSGPQWALLAHRLCSCVSTVLCPRMCPLLNSSGWKDGLHCGSSVSYECSRSMSLQLLVERTLGTTSARVIQPCHPQAQSCRTRDVIPLPMGGPATQGPCILTCGQFGSLAEAGRIYEAGKCCFSDLSSEREMHTAGCSAKW